MAYEALFDFSKFKKGHLFDDATGEVLLAMFEAKTPHVAKLAAPSVMPQELPGEKILTKINGEQPVEKHAEKTATKTPIILHEQREQKKVVHRRK